MLAAVIDICGYISRLACLFKLCSAPLGIARIVRAYTTIFQSYNDRRFAFRHIFIPRSRSIEITKILSDKIMREREEFDIAVTSTDPKSIQFHH